MVNLLFKFVDLSKISFFSQFIRLMFFNKTERDILFKQKLDLLSAEDSRYVFNITLIAVINLYFSLDLKSTTCYLNRLQIGQD